ncbi:tetratricopeptide repeat protein [Miltoncostaea marina]|uniref:tetratricopeptide repeat protein n=1 Tax=Miltoncostaea marina TaxID=2843215 RepID=UPI001C3D82D4|nr:tetratricopeptide repeat protein [Miltoncostaea marina]
MLLDQKRTKRTVQIVAIITSIAFAGVIFVVLGLILFGGGETPEDVAVADAKERVEASPREADEWAGLASAYLGAERYDEAVDAAERAVQLAPKDIRVVQTLVTVQTEAGREDEAIATLQDFTRRNPRNAEAFLQLGQMAQSAGRTQLARLSFQTFLRLAPDHSLAESVRDALDGLAAGGGARP